MDSGGETIKQKGKKILRKRVAGWLRGGGSELSRHSRYNIISRIIISHSPMNTSLEPRARVVCEKHKNRPPNVREKRDDHAAYTGGTQHYYGARIQPRSYVCAYIMYHSRADLSDLFTCHPSGQLQPTRVCVYIHIIRYAVIRLGLPRVEGQYTE